MIFNFALLNDFMVYNNSFEFVIKVLGKDLPIKIFQTSKLIECQYSCIEYSQKTKFIDTNLKLAMKHFFIQAQVDYLDSICNKNNLTTHDLGFFSNMFVMRSLTSAPSIDLFNISNNSYQQVKTIFFSDKKLCGVLGNQYLSPITTFLFTDDWNKLTQIHKYEKILDYDKNFNLSMLTDINCMAESAWQSKAFSNEYNSFENFSQYFKEIINQQYWIHNYGDYKIYKSPNSYLLYPEIYQILYNLDFKFDELSNSSKIVFDSIFFDSNLINQENLSKYKSFPSFSDQVSEWRDKGEILIYKKNLLFLHLLNEKYELDDYLESDLRESLQLMLKKAEENDVICYLFFLPDKKLNIQRIKLIFNSDCISFYYFIPFFEIKDFENNLFLVGIKKSEQENILTLFNMYFYENNHINIVNIFLNNVIWEKTDLYNHFLFWNDSSLVIVSSFIDFVSGGLVSLIPKTWKN